MDRDQASDANNGTTRDPSIRLAELYEADRAEHRAIPEVGTSEYRDLRERDCGRRRAAEEAIAELRDHDRLSAADAFHAAWLYNHGDRAGEALEAHKLALEASSMGHPKARWLAAAAYDRWCMYEGRPQKYGTQFVPDGKRYRLWDVDPTTTDKERAAWDVPSLENQLARAEDMTRREPQPPMSDAPAWLKEALPRWKSED